MDNNITFYIFRENGIWKMYIQDCCNTILSTHTFEDSTTIDEIICFVRFITKASNTQVQVNFTKTIKEINND